MRLFGGIGLALLLLAGGAGCKKDSAEPAARTRLLGTWDTEFTAFDADTNFVLRESEKAYFAPSSHLYYSFSDTGVLTVADSGTASQDLYFWAMSSNGTSLRLIPRQDTSRPLFYHVYSLTDKALILEDTAASGVVSWVGMIKR